MPLAPRTQNILLLVGIPCGIAAGFAVASGNDIAVMAAIILLPHAFAALFCWLAYKGLKTGVISGRGGPTYRDKQPIFYWINFTMLAVAAAGTLTFAAFADAVLRSAEVVCSSHGPSAG